MGVGVGGKNKCIQEQEEAEPKSEDQRGDRKKDFVSKFYPDKALTICFWFLAAGEQWGWRVMKTVCHKELTKVTGPVHSLAKTSWGLICVFLQMWLTSRSEPLNRPQKTFPNCMNWSCQLGSLHPLFYWWTQTKTLLPSGSSTWGHLCG